MIIIDFRETKERIFRLKIEGHSKSAIKGEDIVCAGVSALAQTLVSGCEAELNAEVSGKLESGLCDIKISANKENFEKLQAVCSVFKFGFRKLAEAYPKHIKLN